MEPTAGNSLLFTGITFLIVEAGLAALSAYVSHKKGRQVIVAIVLSFVPIVGTVYLFYLLTLTNKDVLEQMARIDERLKELGK